MGRIWHILGINASEEGIRHIIFFDTEAYVNQTDSETQELDFRLACCNYVRLDKNGEIVNEETKGFNNLPEFWDYILSKHHDKEKLWIMGYNLDHDFRQIKGFSTLFNLGWELYRFISENNKYIIQWRKGRKTIQFNDLGNYYGRVGLKVIGDMVGIQKETVDFENVSNENLFKYCFNDLNITKTAFMRVYKWWKAEKLGNFALTTASLAFNAFKHKFMSNQIFIHVNAQAIKLERASYRGGRCECFFIGKLEGKKLYKLDVNSMYPFVMRENKYPTKLVIYNGQGSVNGLMRAMTHYLVIAKCKIKIKEPAIGIKRDKLLFPVGEFWAYLTTPEILYILKHGQILQVAEYAIYEYAYIFSDFVKYFTTRREEEKNKGNALGSMFFKLVQNSLYGKFGQRNIEWEQIEEKSPLEYGYFLMINVTNQRRDAIKVINHTQFQKIGYEEAYDSFVAIPSFVSAYARMYLWELIEPIKDHVFYCDTDSLVVDAVGLTYLQSVGKIGSQLGQLKIEAEANSAEFKLPKVYRFGYEYKVKGINGPNVAAAFRGETVKQNHWLRTPSLIHMGVLDRCIIKIREKSIVNAYSKGIVSSSGRVKPFVLDESVTDITDEELAKLRHTSDRKIEAEYKAWKDSSHYDKQDEDTTLTADERFDEFKRKGSIY
jgi:hypothetical protein